MPQLTIDSAILQTLLKRATSAARLVSHIEDAVGYLAVDLLADDIDTIVHELSELLGNPTLIVRPVANELAPVPDSAALVNAFADEESTQPRVRRLRPAYRRRRQRVERASRAIRTEAVSSNSGQARESRAPMIEHARSAEPWMRAATVAALTLLVGLVLWALGACGGVR